MKRPRQSLFPPNDYTLLAVILGLPLLGAFVNGVFGKRLGKHAVRLMALTAVGVSFVAVRRHLRRARARVDASGETPSAHVKLVWKAWEWMHTTAAAAARSIPIDVDVQRRRAERHDDARRHRRRLPHPPLLDDVHGERHGLLRASSRT